MPFAPKKYEIKKNKGDAVVNVMFGKDTLIDADGVIDVTAFDARHIAGTIELAGKVMPGKKPVKISGSFDLICPGYKGCKYD
jgi:hypothetical protein